MDVWGEGRISAYGIITGFDDNICGNLNHQDQKISNGPNTGQDIPNLIPVQNYSNHEFDIRDNVVYNITVMGAPINTKTAQEMLRVLKYSGNSKIILYGFDRKDRNTFESIASSHNLVYDPYYPLSDPFTQISFHGETRVYRYQGLIHDDH